MKRTKPLVRLVLLGLFSSMASAVDGVLEINHTCATQLGCFSGDSLGYPIEIDGSAGRSYRLTSDLIVPSASTDGIKVDSPSISIDLNGFEIVRSGCEGATLDCTPVSGSGSGINGSDTIYSGLSVRNGSVTGMGRYGINLLGRQSEIREVRVRWNRSAGIVAGPGSTVSGNTLYGNGGDGIFVSVGASVIGNTSFDNGGDGIVANAGSTVQSNTVRSNAGYGLNLNSTAAYRENVITINSGGSVNGGYNMGSNFCNTNATCP